MSTTPYSAPFGPGDDDPLQNWLGRPHLPVLVLDEEPGAQIILAMLHRAAVAFTYYGGSTPGKLRTVRPSEVFRLEEDGPVYVRAWCEIRRAERTFRLDRARLSVVAQHRLSAPRRANRS